MKVIVKAFTTASDAFQCIIKSFDTSVHDFLVFNFKEWLVSQATLPATSKGVQCRS